MENHGVSRKDAADYLGITAGHLSTLINVNRTATQAQVDKSREMMGLGVSIYPPPPPIPHEGPPQIDEPAPKKPRRRRRPNNLRPLNEFETRFVESVAKTWIDSNKNATQDDLVDVVRALSIGIRT
jgi:hypothetical protein